MKIMLMKESFIRMMILRLLGSSLKRVCWRKGLLFLKRKFIRAMRRRKELLIREMCILSKQERLHIQTKENSYQEVETRINLIILILCNNPTQSKEILKLHINTDQIFTPLSRSSRTFIINLTDTQITMKPTLIKITHKIILILHHKTIITAGSNLMNLPILT